MLTLIGGLFTKALAGGASGLIGSLATNIFSYFQNKQAHKQKMEERSQDRLDRQQIHQNTIAELDKEIQVTHEIYKGKVDVSEADAFKESQKTILQPALQPSIIDKMFNMKGLASIITIPIAAIIASLLGFVDFLKHLMRPGLTIYISVLYGIMVFKAYGILEANNYQWTEEQAVIIITGFVDLTIYMVSMIWGWWFADRRISKNMKKIMDK